MSQRPRTYPTGALVRVRQICGTKDEPGLLPIAAATWWRWVATGVAPPGRKIGPHATAWLLEDVLTLGSKDVE